jgi:hypothetical protein
MPVNRTLYDALVKQLGPKEGKKRYYQMESKGGAAFKKGLKTAVKEGHTTMLGKKKP